jgi:hypothetical protein
VTKTELFRRRIAPVLFGVAIALTARKSCHEDRAHATFVLDLGAARADVRAIDAEFWVNDQVEAELHRNALDGQTMPTPQFETTVPSADGELRVDASVKGAHKHIVRRLHVNDGETVTVRLGPDLE